MDIGTTACSAAADTGAAAGTQRRDIAAVDRDRAGRGVGIIAVADTCALGAFRCDRTAVDTNTLAGNALVGIVAYPAMVSAAEARAAAVSAEGMIAAVDRDSARRAVGSSADARTFAGFITGACLNLAAVDVDITGVRVCVVFALDRSADRRVIRIVGAAHQITAVLRLTEDVQRRARLYADTLVDLQHFAVFYNDVDRSAPDEQTLAVCQTRRLVKIIPARSEVVG